MEADIAIVGAGPRGISITERIAAFLNDRGATPLTLHIIDDAQLGAGRIWDTEQTRTLCMNTLAGAVTLFTEPGATVTVRDPAGQPLGTATVDPQGNYTLPLATPQANGETLTITQSDPAGNISPATTISAPDTSAACARLWSSM